MDMLLVAEVPVINAEFQRHPRLVLVHRASPSMEQQAAILIESTTATPQTWSDWLSILLAEEKVQLENAKHVAKLISQTYLDLLSVSCLEVP